MWKNEIFVFFASAQSTDTDECVACVNTAAVHRMQGLVQVLFYVLLPVFFFAFAGTKVQILTQRGMQGGPECALLQLSLLSAN